MDENRDFLIIDEYINSICKKIMSPRKKNEVYDELYSHLIEEYEKYISLGLDDESAQSKAIEKMGDKDKIANDFGKLYSIIPTEYMRSSLNFIIWGMALGFFQINLFPGMGKILKFAAVMDLLYGLLKLRKTNKKLNFAFYLFIGVEFYSLIVQGFSLFTIGNDAFIYAGQLIATILNTIVYWCIFSGIKDITKNLVSDEDKKPRLTGGFIAYVLSAIIIVFAATTEATYIAMGTPIFMIFALCQLGRAKKILAYKEPEFDISEPIKKSEKISYAIIVIILAISPVFLMLSAASPKVDTVIYNIADSTIEKSKIEKARANMLELGFPEEYLKDLTDSEVMKYDNANLMKLENTDDIKQTTLANDRETICTIEHFYFFYPDGEMRVLLRGEFPENSKAKYRKGLYHQFYDRDVVPIDEDINAEEFFIALSEKDGKTYSSAPLSEYMPKNAIDKFYISGFEFTFEKGTTNKRVYLAHSAQLKTPSLIMNSCTDGVFLWQKFPVSAYDTTINDMAIREFSGTISFPSDLEPIRRRDLYHSFEYNSDYTVKNSSTIDNSNKN